MKRNKKFIILIGLVICFSILFSILSSFTLVIKDQANNQTYPVTYYFSIGSSTSTLNFSESNLLVEQVSINSFNGSNIVSRTINQRTSITQLNKFNNFLNILKSSNTSRVNVKFIDICLIAILLTLSMYIVCIICSKFIKYVYYYVDRLSTNKIRLFLVLFFSSLYLIGALFNDSVKNFQSNSDNLVYMKYLLKNTDIPSQVAIYQNNQLLYIEDIVSQSVNPSIVQKCEENTINLCYKPYVSSFGLQAIMFNKIGQICEIQSILWFRVICQVIEIICLAIVLAEILLLFNREFGKEVFIVLFIGLSLTYVLAKFAPSAYWNLWIMFIPFLVSSKYMLDKNSFLFQNDKLLLILLGGIFLIKMLCGYEWLTTLILSGVVPLLWNGENISITGRVLLLIKIMVISVISFILSLLLWWYQLGSEGFYSAFISDLIRWVSIFYPHNIPQGASIYNEGVNIGIIPVLVKLFFTPDFFIFFGFYIVIALFIFSSYYFRFIISKQMKSLQKLILISFIAPLSWFVMAKSHSYVHAYLSYVLWLIPSGMYIYIFLGMIYHLRKTSSK